MRGLTKDEIADLLITIRPRSPEEEKLKRQAEEYVSVRDRARREDAAQAPELANVRQTFETAKAIAELRREVLLAAEPALGDYPDLASEVRLVVARKLHVPISGGSADKEIGDLKSAREAAPSYARDLGDLIDRAMRALPADHPVVGELQEASELL